MHNLLHVLGGIRPSSTFLSIRGYRAASGEVADHQICFHMSYRHALEKSIAALEAMTLTDPIEIQARSELIASYQRSLEKLINEPLEAIGDHYDRVVNAEGEHVKGVKIHRESGDLHLFGLALGKVIHVPGEYREVKSSEKTLAKARLSKGLPAARCSLSRASLQ